jgi:type IV secretion system protein VirB9
MDTRRCLSLIPALVLCGCATFGVGKPPLSPAAPSKVAAVATTPPPRPLAVMDPIPNPPSVRPAAVPKVRGESGQASAAKGAAAGAEAGARAAGPPAIAAANRRARAPSSAAGFVGGMQVFRYEPGRIYEVWTAPLRVTVLSLPPGETVISKAAGDTVRWQIGETTSGDGPGRQTHVVLKPLETGLETNLVLSTSARLYLVQLRSGQPGAFNAAVAWEAGAPAPAAPVTHAAGPVAQGTLPPLASGSAGPAFGGGPGLRSERLP